MRYSNLMREQQYQDFLTKSKQILEDNFVHDALRFEFLKTPRIYDTEEIYLNAPQHSKGEENTSYSVLEINLKIDRAYFEWVESLGDHEERATLTSEGKALKLKLKNLLREVANEQT